MDPKLTHPCIITIFGATGDLTARKLMPAIYHLFKENILTKQFALVGFARKVKTDLQFREEMKKAVQQFSRSQPLDEDLWNQFASHLFYHESEFLDHLGYQKLNAKLQQLDAQFLTQGNRIFYLATSPSYFPPICSHLKEAGLIYDTSMELPWSRVVIEKPFGHNLSSASDLQHSLLTSLQENQIYRIDHWLGKETVQNLLVFRFANSIFEPLWNHNYIDHVQITASEDLGIGSRGRFWEETGLLRDIIQNHVMQVLSLVAMEPPLTLEAEMIRQEKIRLLKSIRPLDPNHVVRSQYTQGLIQGKPVCGYLQEADVDSNSSVETYCAFKLYIDNARWANTPFYIRSGKRLSKKCTEVVIVFKEHASPLFPQGQEKKPNMLVLQIQPEEGAFLQIQCKVPGFTDHLQPVKMDFSYASYFHKGSSEAYERLFYDAILGDLTLFAAEEEVLLSWKLFSPILELWDLQNTEGLSTYPAGSLGPKEADQLVMQDHVSWKV